MVSQFFVGTSSVESPCLVVCRAGMGLVAFGARLAGRALSASKQLVSMCESAWPLVFLWLLLPRLLLALPCLRWAA
jgi:hypothetical protein